MMPTTHGEQSSTINRDSQAYWNKRAATFTRDATSDYERWLLDLLALEEGEEVLDMGCATGTLAVPLARAGHRVHGCDFAEAMLAILDERAAAENLPITSHLLAWEDDWEAAGSRPEQRGRRLRLAFPHERGRGSAVRKLDSAARSRAAVVVPDSLLPSRDPRLLTYLGRSTRRPRIVRDVTRALTALGRIPIFATTRTFRPMRFSSFDEARVRPSSPGRPRAVHRARAATFRRVRGPAHRAPGSRIPVSGDGRETWVLDYPSARHLGVYRLAHRREPVGVPSPGLVLS